MRDVAEQIGVAGLSCALIRAGGGVGIVTDVGFRQKVATGKVHIDAPITDLATMPALTIDEDATQAQGLLHMIERGVHHLVVVDRAGPPSGVLRAVDLAGAEIRDPLLIRSAIDDAADVEELAAACRLLPGMLVELCDDAVPATQIGAIHTAVVDAAIRRTLCLQHHPLLDGVRHSWVLLGSLARREPLPLSDVDTTLVWADLPADGGGPDVADRIRLKAREVPRGLQRCGFTLCANGANGHNPLFSRARSGWIAAARGWQRDPTQGNALLLSAMVAGGRPLTDPDLGGALSQSIRSHTRTSQFLRALLDEALGWRPPAGFIRDFVVHHSGDHRGQLDLKPGGLTPVVALARWIAIAALTEHGLRSADLAYAPPIDDVLDELIDLLSGRVPVAHAAWVERAFLDRALRPRGRRLPPMVLDTAALLRTCRFADPAAGHEPKLEASAKRLGLPVHTPHHALGDAFTTAHLLLALATRLERTAGDSRPRYLPSSQWATWTRCRGTTRAEPRRRRSPLPRLGTAEHREQRRQDGDGSEHGDENDADGRRDEPSHKR